MKTGASKLLRMGLIPARVWKEQAVATSPAERAKVEEADGSSSRQDRVSILISLHGVE